MTKQTKIALFIIGISLFVGMMIFLSRRKNKDGTPDNTSGRNPGRSSRLNCSRLLKKGVYDAAEVVLLQQELNDYTNKNLPQLIPPLVIDGDFGDLTEDALENALNSLENISVNKTNQISLQNWYRYTGRRGSQCS